LLIGHVSFDAFQSLAKRRSRIDYLVIIMGSMGDIKALPVKLEDFVNVAVVRRKRHKVSGMLTT
jgi:hypothetical protein